MARLLGIITVVLAVVIGLSFAALNADTVEVKYYLGATQAPLALVIVVSLSLGALLGVLASVGIVVGQKRRIGKLRRTVSMHEKEIRNLRELPIRDRQ